MNRIALAAAALALVLSACRGDDGPSGDDTPQPDAPLVVGEVTIQEIQNAAMAVGTVVEVKGVVVTVIDAYGNRTGDLWVQEVGGGAFSGIKVFGAPLDQIAALVPGDIVDIVGAQKDEFAYMAMPDDPTVTELKPVEGGTMTITKVGSGAVPAPADVDASAISLLATPELRDAEWEKWEGVLVKVTKARQLGTVGTFGSSPGPDSNEFRATAFLRVQSALVELPNTSTAGTCYESMTGVVDFFFNWILAPRTAGDLVVGGTACRPAATTINGIQTGTNVEYASLTNVYVSAVSFSRKNIWLSTSLTGAANEGIAVFRGTSTTVTTLPADVVAGARVSVSGVAVEANNDANGDPVTQITSPVITVTAAPTTQVTPVAGQTVTNLMAAGTGEPYESVLVTLTNVKVNTVGTSTNFNVSDLAGYPGNVAFKADDDVYRFVTGDMNACYASITGIWSYSIFDNIYLFLPTAVGTGTGTCN